ncbi:integrase [Caballeronia mineralivorans PML1(12)]|uniref:Integrase n=1 Tax=Caballeronia mineralivorans PML1(12) TaxID=908627 RepID=A0A0J1FQ05_9BURK|nr:tyrosine-type recombinase/integrase [Caballeronia mineralivorans]KLU21843.1 integrase [Caballeronia mineralivorans PML1(12)]
MTTAKPKNLTTISLNALRKDDKPRFDAATPGLLIVPTANGRGRWTFRYVSPLTKKRRDMGLGSYTGNEDGVSIAEPREKARIARKLVGSGVDPIDERQRVQQVVVATEREQSPLTFEKAAREVHGDLKPGWKNAKHADQWISTLVTYAFPTLGPKPLTDISPKDCADALRKIWLKKAETARRTKQRMHVVFEWAWAQGHVKGNPASVVHRLLPKQKPKKDHQPAMPWLLVPRFVATHLVDREVGDCTKAALEFAILTAARSGEVRETCWSEFSPDWKLWTISAQRMKMDKPHRVPLSERAAAIVKHQYEHRRHPTLVFPSPRDKMLSDMTLTALLRRAKAVSDTPGRVATAHGFRSSFRDWASEHGYARDLAERALAHAIENDTEAAYHRTDLINLRRPMMQARVDFISSGDKEVNSTNDASISAPLPVEA